MSNKQRSKIELIIFTTTSSISKFRVTLVKNRQKKHYKGINVYYIRYITITKIGDCENIDSVNPLYLLVNQASRYIEEIKAIKGDKGNDYGQDYMKIKFSSGNGLPLNKPLKLHAMTIIIKSVFEEGGKLYPQVFLEDCLYEL